MSLFRIVIVALVAGLLATCAGPSRPDEASPITGKLSEEGYGPIRIGEPLPADVPLAWSDSPDANSEGPDTDVEYEFCHYSGVETSQGFVFVMLRNNVVARIETEDKEVRLSNGLGVGSVREDIIAAYGDDAVSRRNFYTGSAGYIDYMVRRPGNTGVYFLLEGNDNVHAFQVGRFPELEWVEGCQ